MNEMIVKPTTKVGAVDWQTMKDQAGVIMKSGFLPPSIKTPEQCLAIFMTGKELGIGFMESIRSINVIQGKPTVSPQLMLAMANRTGEIEDQKIEATDQGATVTIKRKGRTAHTEVFGVAEATAMGLMSKDNYRKQPATMFKWRALAANLRVTFPDVLLGLYTPEELGANVAVNDDGEMAVTAPETITEAQGRDLVALAKSKGVTAKEIAEKAGVSRLGEITKEQFQELWDRLTAYQPEAGDAQEPAEADDLEKRNAAAQEALIRLGVTSDQIGKYVETLPYAASFADVVAHLEHILKEFKQDKIPEYFASVVGRSEKKAKNHKAA